MTISTCGRFVNNYISELRHDNWSPISGFKDRTLKSLEQAVESIVPLVNKVKEHAEEAKRNCTRNTALTINESAAIYLYTMGSSSFYEILNAALRTENPRTLEPWFDYLKLFMTALAKLPSCSYVVWRGAAGVEGSNFGTGHMLTWWSINSCSSRARVAAMFGVEKGTLFCINAINGKEITEYSWNKAEEEVILMPSTRLLVKSTTLDIHGFYIVHLEER